MNRKEKAIEFRKAAQLAANTATTDQAYEIIGMYDEWSGNGVSYPAGTKVTRGGTTIYNCTIGHVSQADWAPEVAVSLWEVV